MAENNGNGARRAADVINKWALAAFVAVVIPLIVYIWVAQANEIEKKVDKDVYKAEQKAIMMEIKQQREIIDVKLEAILDKLEKHDSDTR